jgi:hypothetical protein
MKIRIMRFSPAVGIALVVFAAVGRRTEGGAAADPPPAPIVAVQPVEEYFAPFEPDPKERQPGLPPRERITHLGTDFGPMGPARHRVVWKDGQACADLRDARWAGIWHSLAGLARESESSLDFQHCYPAWIAASRQPRCTGVILRLSGHGSFKVEIKAADQKVLWSWKQAIDAAAARDFTLDCPPETLRAAKFLNWVAEPGSDFAVDRVALRLEFPSMPFPDRVFLIGYAKLARCYDPKVGIVKNRAHWPTGSFDAVPASGLFALATAVASTRGVAERPFAEKVLHDIHRTMSVVPRADGWLPHFISRDPSGRYTIHPGTEYSTVDTSLYYHGMILSAQILGDKPMLAHLEREVKSLRFDGLRGADGWINHGFRADGETLLRGDWNGWGGETALTLLLERMALGDRAALKMALDGHVHNGVGFIGEIQSLFYPQFDQPRPDAVSGIDWRASRLALLAEQQAYYPTHEPQSAAAKLGLYGLSAGEGFRGRGYVANGTRKVRADLIHPHYVLLAGRWQPAKTYELLGKMEANGLLPPWGLVENVKPDLGEYLPMLGSLNAAFECLGAHHIWARHSGQPDVIDAAARDCPLTAAAIRGFYPAVAP